MTTTNIVALPLIKTLFAAMLTCHTHCAFIVRARDVLLLSYEQNGDVSECWGLFEKNRRQTGSYGVTEVQTELILCDTFKACGQNIMTSPQMKVMTSTELF